MAFFSHNAWRRAQELFANREKIENELTSEIESNIDSVALKIGLQVLYLAMGKDVYTNIIELMSIDFLSVDHQIYSWTTSGNYSPSKLYRNGMIEGSPFNVYSIDFIAAFQTEGDN